MDISLENKIYSLWKIIKKTIENKLYLIESKVI